MRFPLLAAVMTGLIAMSSIPAHAAEDEPTPKPSPLVETRGLPMSAQEAMERVTFHPFIPSPRYSEVALLPAFHGDDKDHPENRGVGYEYVSVPHRFFMREWPLGGGSLDKYPAAPPNGSCKTGHFTAGSPDHPGAYAWTSGNLVFALQIDEPDGMPDPAGLKKEWSRLIGRGACR